MRSLRPLRRRAPDPRRAVLDEDATAQSAAQSGIVVPAFRDGEERAWSMTVVVDTGPAMPVWAKLEAELLRLFHHLGAFRDLQKWYLRTSEERVLGVSRTARPDSRPRRGAGRPAALRNISELADPAGRRVILLLSDAASGAWYSGAITEVLRQWAAAGPLAIVQPLPPQLWARTGLAPLQGRVTSPFAGAPNTRLRFRPQRRTVRALRGLPGAAPTDGHDSSLEPVPVPVLGLGPDWLGAWAGFIASPPGARLDCTVTLARAVHPERFPPPLAADSPRQRVQRFAEQASPEALRLAVYLSATELSLPVMRHVQAALLPGTGPSHLAEVLLGGLVATADAAQNPDAPEEWRYEFAHGVRELLLAGLGRSQARRVLALVSEELGHRFGLSADEFTAALAAPADDASASLPMSVKPFAEIARQVLERIDGRFTLDGPPRQPSIPATASPLDRAAALIRRYQRGGKVRDLDEAIGVLQGDPFWEPAAQPAPGQDAEHVTALALALRLRFSASGQRADLDEAVELIRDTSTESASALQRAALRHEFSAILGLRYALTGDLDDLDAAIEAARAAATDAADGEGADRYAGALGAFLLRRARRMDSATDLDEAIGWLRTAIAGQSLDGQERARVGTDLAAALRVRAMTAEPATAAADLDAGIGAMRAALEITPEDSAEHAFRLNELAAALAARAAVHPEGAGARAAALREAADVYRRAADSMTARSADRAESLAGLGSSLYDLACDGDAAALPEAVRSLRSAVSQTSGDDPARPRRQAALADALLLRFSQNQSRHELTEAAHFLELAVAGAPPGSSERARYLTALGLTYERRYEVARMPHDLALAAAALRQASTIASAEDIPRIRLSFARILNAQAMHQEAGRVLHVAITQLANELGQDHPRTLAARLELARVYAQGEMTADAISVLDDLIPVIDRVQGPDSPQARAARGLKRELLR
jgi:hypothetical protein